MTRADPARTRRVGPEWHPAVVHACGSPGTPYHSSLVLHAVLAPRRPGQTPLGDLMDAGYEVVAYGVFSSEVPGCPEAEDYPQGTHILLRRE